MQRLVQQLKHVFINQFIYSLESEDFKSIFTFACMWLLQSYLILNRDCNTKIRWKHIIIDGIIFIFLTIIKQNIHTKYSDYIQTKRTVNIV